MTQVACDGLIIKIDGVRVEDANLARLLESNPEIRWPEVIERALAVGARGLLTMGLDLDVAGLRAEIGREVAALLETANSSIGEMLRRANQALTERLDPDQRSSIVARTLSELEAHRDSLLGGLDLNRVDSEAAALVKTLQDMIGEGGQIEQRLVSVLNGDEAGLASLTDRVMSGFSELRDLMNESKGRAAEARLGTRKGFAYEDMIDENLCRHAAAIGGCVVERVSAQGGRLGSHALVGDFTLTLPAGARVVVEAKNTSKVGLVGENGILAELDRAMDNREAEYAICVAAEDVYPREVGGFGVYGNRVLVVDPGDGTMLGAAIRWIMAADRLRATAGEGVDLEPIRQGLETLKRTAQRFSSLKRNLSEMQGSLGTAKEAVDALRADVLDAADTILADLPSSG